MGASVDKLGDDFIAHATRMGVHPDKLRQMLDTADSMRAASTPVARQPRLAAEGPYPQHHVLNGRQFAGPHPHDDELNPIHRQLMTVEHHETEPGYHSFTAHGPRYYNPETDSLRREGLGHLGVEHTPDQGHVIHEIGVADNHQNEGVGTALYRAAQAKLGEVKHSNVKTDAGRAWAAKVGGPSIAGPQFRHQY